MVKSVSFSLLSLVMSSAIYAQQPANSTPKTVKPFTAHYNIIHKSDPVGTGVRKLSYLENGDALYSYHTDVEWLIFSDIRDESSTLSIEDGKVIPSQYHFKREGTGKDKEYHWQYDLAGNKATNVIKEKTVNVDYPANIQDKLSYHLQNRLNLAQNPEQQHFVYPVIGTKGSIKNYVYQYDGEEEIMLPFGLVKTIRLKREVVEKKRVTYAWFAPELDYLLVKLYQKKSNFEQLEAQLTSLEIDGKTITSQSQQ